MCEPTDRASRNITGTNPLNFQPLVFIVSYNKNEWLILLPLLLSVIEYLTYLYIGKKHFMH